MYCKSYARDHLKFIKHFDRRGCIFSFAALMLNYTSFLKTTAIQKTKIDEQGLHTIFPHLMASTAGYGF